VNIICKAIIESIMLPQGALDLTNPTSIDNPVESPAEEGEEE
jgi:hypothetical protein